MTTIDPTTLPDGTAIEVRDELGEELRYSLKGGTTISKDGVNPYSLGDRTITRVFAPVPDGMTYADVEAALADAGAWVEIPNVDNAPEGARLRNDWRNGDSGNDVLYVHRDDLPPTDPDADLVEKMARAQHQQDGGTAWDALTPFGLDKYLTNARRLIAVVREHEATR